MTISTYYDHNRTSTQRCTEETHITQNTTKIPIENFLFIIVSLPFYNKTYVHLFSHCKMF